MEKLQHLRNHIDKLRQANSTSEMSSALVDSSDCFSDIHGDINLAYSGENLPDNDFGNFLREFIILYSPRASSEINKLKQKYPNSVADKSILQTEVSNYISVLQTELSILENQI